ncbi:MAG: NAD-dependent epimerase/dehydratase family protein [Desulfocapsa sp.]|nr:NAD-dependent epimerase/dehydratase family protein [Desulfocapsa sp.]
MTDKRVGLIGASSFVGEQLRLFLETRGYQVVAFSRQGGEGTLPLRQAGEDVVDPIRTWFYLAPIWTLPEHFHLFEIHGAQRLIALSSTSRFSKKASPSSSDRVLASRLIEGEEQGMKWAGLHGCSLVIFQPTLIYGLGKDKNVTEIAGLIQRLGFFPILGAGTGLRQPVHVDDVVSACIAALQVPDGTRQAYVLSGDEVLSYRLMVERIFTGLGRKPRFVRCPLLLFSLVVWLLNLVPFVSAPTTEMAVRMNKDQNFDHDKATADLGFTPRPFNPERSDLV